MIELTNNYNIGNFAVSILVKVDTLNQIVYYEIPFGFDDFSYVYSTIKDLWINNDEFARRYTFPIDMHSIALNDYDVVDGWELKEIILLCL